MNALTVLNIGHHNHVRAGSDRYMVELGALLEAHGARVIPFATRHADNDASRWNHLFPDGVDTASGSLSNAFRFVYSRQAKDAIRRVLELVKVDVAHLHIYYGQLTASILSPLLEAGVPIVQTLHEFKLGCPVYTFYSNDRICEACAGRHFWKAMLRRCNKRSLRRTALSVAEAYTSRLLGDVRKVDHFISPSSFLRNKMLQHGILDETRITRIPYQIDCFRHVPANGPGDYAAYFGRIAHVKGLDTLIRAVGPLPSVELKIAGRGPARRELEAEVKAQGWRHIQFVGFKTGTELADFIRGSVCTVLPSVWYDNLPLAIMESMAYARPVIASDIGGIPELIDDGQNGLLTPPGDHMALRQAIERMMRDPIMASAMGQKARDKMVRDFSPASHYRRIVELYQTVM